MKPKQKRIDDDKVLDKFRGIPCAIACCGQPSDPCHIKSRGAGGDDVEWNLIGLCRAHHSEQHSYGWRRFCADHMEILMILADKGWAINYMTGKIKHFPDAIEKPIKAETYGKFTAFMMNKSYDA